MSRRQSLDRPGILSPPGPFLTPSPSPSISASPRLQPSPSLSPFPQDVLLVAGNTITNTSQDQERKAATPGRRQSIHQFTNGSPNAGTVVFQPSPSQSPAAATSVIGVTAGFGGTAVTAATPAAGNEFNTTLVGSNNIQLNKKGNKRSTQQQQQHQLSQQHHQIFSTVATLPTTCHPASSVANTVAGGYGQSHATAINTPSSFATANVASCPKGQTKKAAATVLPTTALSQQHHQQFQQYHSSSPLIADSPIPSPSNTITSAAIKPPTPQPMQMLQQQFTITGSAPHQASHQAAPTQQVFQFIQGPQGQIIAAPATHQPHQQHSQQQQHRFIGSTATVQTNVTPTYSSHSNVATTSTTTKSTKAPQQILPKPQQQPGGDAAQQQQKTKGAASNVVSAASNMPQMPQISQSPQPQQAQISVSATPTSSTQQQQQQIILPAGATASLATQQPLLLNQMPVLVQQNTPQGVQLILRPPTPQLTATPSLVIQNARPQPQLQQQQPQQLLRILGTNGATMQFGAATPTFIVSSQANLIQQTANHIQTIKTNPQTPAITQLTGLHAALSAAAAANTPRSQPFTTAATINTSHLLGPSMAAQLQNLQLAAAANGGSITQIQMPNGLSAAAGPATTTILSQLPAQFQQSLSNATGGLINLNQLSGANLQQIAAAAAAAGATFQTPPPPTAASSSTADIFNAALAHSSPAHVPLAVTPEPLRQSTPVLQNTGATVTLQQQQLSNGTTIINTMPGGNAPAATIQIQQQQQQPPPQQVETAKKKPKPRKRKPAASAAAASVAAAAPASSSIVTTAACTSTSAGQIVSSSVATAIGNRSNAIVSSGGLVPTSASNNSTFSTAPTSGNSNNQFNQQQQQQFTQSNSQHLDYKTQGTKSTSPTSSNNNSHQQQQQQQQSRPKSPSPTPQITRASNGKLDLGNVMKLCGIMEDDDDDEDYGMDMTAAPSQAATEESTGQSAAAPPPTSSASSSTTSTTLSNSNEIMISIPNQNGSDALPFTLTIPATAAAMAASGSSGAMDGPDAHNIFIKIDQNDATAPPYTISIPRLPTAEEIQQQAQQHLAQQAAAAAAAQHHQQQQAKGNTATNVPTISFSLSSAQNAANVAQQQALQQHINQITQSATSTPTSSTYLSSSMPLTMGTNSISTAASNNSVATVATITTPTSTTTSTSMCTLTPTATTTTTAAVKPRRKPAVRRNGKKPEPSVNATATTVATSTATTNANPHSAAATITPTALTTTPATTTPTTTLLHTATTPAAAQVPSQIGNIQISQVDATKLAGQSALPTSVSNAVENKIQIMPILEGTNVKMGPHSSGNTTQFPHLQQQQPQQAQHHQHQQPQLLFQPPTSSATSHETNMKLTADGRQVQLVAIPQSPTATTPTSATSSSTAIASNNSMSSATILPPQLTGMPGNVSISVGSPASAAALLPQLTGSLTLAVSEHCERLILRHDPNQPQDQQSQLILQALLKGALPNLTIINEPTKMDSGNSHSHNNSNKPLPSTAIHQQQQQQQQQLFNGPKTVIAPSTGAISKNNLHTHLPAPTLTSSTIKSPTIQPQLNTSPGNQTAAGTTTSNTSTVQLQQQQEAKRIVYETTKQSLTTKTVDLQHQQQQQQQQHQHLLPLTGTQQPQQQQHQILPQLGQSGGGGTLLNSAALAAAAAAAAAAAQSQQRYVALPKIDHATQQLFCLNTVNNQITPIAATQTTASIGPTERMLIAPAGINAQQLAQCLQQGQIHFNDVNPLPPTTQPMGLSPMVNSAPLQSQQQQQPRLQPPQQQIVHPQPIQPLSSNTSATTSSSGVSTTSTTITKQVANVAPIIDQSKAKLEPPKVVKKKPVRKPKTTTTAADVAGGTVAGIMKNASVVKPMPKLDPLSQKPNNNPVQIVQPNIASGKQMVVVNTSSNSVTTTTTTTTTTNSGIQPFQNLQQTTSGTKLVGVTAPMQQLQPTTTALQQQQQQAGLVNVTPNQRSGTNVAATANSSSSSNLQCNSNLNNSNNSATSIATNSSTANNNNNNNNSGILTEPPMLAAFNSNNSAQPQQQQHTVSRVQTIQLTSQQQQQFKQVQMQIQFLTIKLQHKSLLATLPLPPDFDPAAIAAFNKPMSDVEINMALQRLYLEQQRILASGKEIPTPEGLLQAPTVSGGGYTLLPPTLPPPIQQQQNQQNDAAKSNGSSNSIPANVVQPNNHSTTTTTIQYSNASSAAAGNNLQQQPQQQSPQTSQSNVTHRIHIYPMQHHQTMQQNKQQQQQHNKLQQQQQQQQSKAKEAATKGKISNVSQQQQQQQQQNTNSNMSLMPQKQPHLITAAKVAANTQQAHLQLQQPAQQFLQQQHKNIQFSIANNTLTNNGPPPLVFSSPIIAAPTSTAASVAAATAIATTMASNIAAQQQQQQQQQQPPQQQQQPNNRQIIQTTTTAAVVSINASTTTVVAPTATTVTTTTTAGAIITANPTGMATNSDAAHTLSTTSTCTTTATVIKSEESLSPKPKLARLSLFIRQLEVDQQSCLKPDYFNPFQNKEEAVKRLIRYHCMYESDEEIPSEEEEEFEHTALQFREKYRVLSSKFQEILLQESFLDHRTSETCQMQQLMIDDLRNEIEELRNAEHQQQLFEQQQKLEKEQDQMLEQQKGLEYEPKTELKPIKNEPEMPKLTTDKCCSNAEESPKLHKVPDQKQQQQIPSPIPAQIKNEIKTEPYDSSSTPTTTTASAGIIVTAGAVAATAAMDKFDLLKNSSNVNSSFAKQRPASQPQQQQQHQLAQRELKKDEKFNWHNAAYGDAEPKPKLNAANFYPPCSKQLNGAMKRDTVDTMANAAQTAAAAYVKKEFENFDIESEITPSFIMKKIEHKETPPVNAKVPHKTSSSKEKLNHMSEPQHMNHQQPQQHHQKSTAAAQSNFDIQQTNNTSAKQQLHQQQQQQDDEWLCIQKELNLINNENKLQQQQHHQPHTTKSMGLFDRLNDDNLNNATGATQTNHMVDLFPNGCISKDSLANSSPPSNSCSQQRQQPTTDQQQQHQNSHHVAAISEFFNSDTDVHKSVETRLEAMFGESPVHLGKNGSDSHDIESGLDEIFGDTKSPVAVGATKNKRIWEQEITSNSFMRSTTSGTIFESEQQQQQQFSSLSTTTQQHHIQLGSNNNPRWMQTMEAQFNDFMATTTNSCATGDTRKRHWNSELMSSASDLEEETSRSKKLCTISGSSTSSSPLSQQHAQQHHDIMDADLLSLHDGIGVEPTATQMLLQHQQQQQQQQQQQSDHGFAQSHQQFANLMDAHNGGLAVDHQQHFGQSHHDMQQQQQQQQQQSHHMQQQHGNHIVGSADFDDDISRHVQNAIDSILNLQNSESDSLNFSLDHSMGSFLGDSMLDDRQQTSASDRRRHLGDELSDCLISGGTAAAGVGDNASNILLDGGHQSHQQQPHHLLNHSSSGHHHTHHSGLHAHTNNHQHHQPTQQVLANDFSCVAAGIDDAVKSIMTS